MLSSTPRPSRATGSSFQVPVEGSDILPSNMPSPEVSALSLSVGYSSASPAPANAPETDFSFSVIIRD